MEDVKAKTPRVEEEAQNYEQVCEQLKNENEQLKLQLESVIKRFRKLSILYNEVIEKFLSE